MDVIIDRSLRIDGTPEQVWAHIVDIPKTLGCIQEATLGDSVSENSYSASIALKFGPVAAKFEGEVTLKFVDSKKMILELEGKGVDKSGKGAMTFNFKMAIRPAAEVCTYYSKLEMDLSGKLNQFGNHILQSTVNTKFDRYLVNLKRVVAGQSISGAHARESIFSR